ncbi:hypothetical protein R1sor_014294 [Riccia sorocarpa]|uniref:Centrosomal protein of 162 kDa n=1 Tax=Riccia sorocarpa TaxID=122646 RepID=A0ABD3HC66_9MARC
MTVNLAYLSRIPDGLVRASDVLKPDERFHLDADDDGDWRTNLSEPRECESQRVSDFSKSIARHPIHHGDMATLDWPESSGLEVDDYTRSDVEREMEFSWARDNVTMGALESEAERHEVGERPQDKLRKENPETREKQRVDDYSLDHDHDDYHEVRDIHEDDFREKQQISSVEGQGRQESCASSGQSKYVVNSVVPSESGGVSKDRPTPTSTSLNTGKSVDQIMCHPLFGEDALHKFSQKAGPSYWAAPAPAASRDCKKVEAGELTSPRHISGCSEPVFSQSVEHDSKRNETHLGGNVTSEKASRRRMTTLTPPKANVSSKPVECTSLRNDSEVGPSKLITASGEIQATETASSIWLSKDDNLGELRVQGLSSEREQLNTGKVESARLRKGHSDVPHLASKKDLKTPSAYLMPSRQRNQLNADRIRSKAYLRNPLPSRASGSKNQSPPQNAKTRRSEPNTSSSSSYHGPPVKATSAVPSTETKKALSLQNLKPNAQLSLGDNKNEASNKDNASKMSRRSLSRALFIVCFRDLLSDLPAGKGKSNEELEDSYLELIGNRLNQVTNMRTSAPEKALPPAATSEQLQAPAPSKVLELHEQLNGLSHQIAEERQQKQQLLQRLAERNQEFERISKDRHDLWEGKLRELQKDKYALQVRVQALEAEDPRQKIKRASENVSLTEGELKRLRQEIMEQEALIKGYQVENEKAVKRLKDIEVTYKERAQLMGEENSRLASQLANIQFAGRQTAMYGSTPTAGKEIQALRTQLQEVQSREAILQLELEKERKASEERGKGSNQKSESEIAILKEMLIKERLEHTQAVELKEEKARLYLESQATVTTMTSRLEDQAKIIAALQSRIEFFESQEESGKENDGRKSAQGRTWNGVQKMKAMKRIDELEKQIKKLEANSKLKDEHIEENQQFLASSLQDGERVKTLEDEVMSLKQQIKDDNSKNIIQSLRHELDQLKQEYSRVCAVNLQLKNQMRSSIENEPSAVKKTKDLEKQMSKLEDSLASKDALIKKLQLRIKELEARKGSVNSTDLPVLANNLKQTFKAGVTNQGEKPNDNLLNDKRNVLCFSQSESTGVDLADERKSLQPLLLRRNVPQSVKDTDHRVAGDEPPTDAPKSEMASLRKQLEAAEIAREVLQKTCTETMRSAALMSMQHQQMLMSLNEAHTLRVADSQHTGQRREQESAGSRKMKNHASELEHAVLEERVKNSAVGLSMCTPPKSPRMAQLQFLRKKIEDMEGRHKVRELEWQRLLQDVKRIPSKQRQENEDFLWQKAFEAKTEEMESFKSEVDLVLEAALAFQRSQLQSASKKEATH